VGVLILVESSMITLQLGKKRLKLPGACQPEDPLSGMVFLNAV
jgi:hypothetical protein